MGNSEQSARTLPCAPLTTDFKPLFRPGACLLTAPSPGYPSSQTPVYTLLILKASFPQAIPSSFSGASLLPVFLHALPSCPICHLTCLFPTSFPYTSDPPPQKHTCSLLPREQFCHLPFATDVFPPKRSRGRSQQAYETWVGPRGKAPPSSCTDRHSSEALGLGHALQVGGEVLEQEGGIESMPDEARC